MKKLESAPLRRLSSSLLTPYACRWAAFAFFAAMLLAGAIPGKADALSAVVYDKLLHFVAYSLLSALIFGALDEVPKVRAWLTLFAVGLLGALDEGVQSLLPYRNGSWFDWQIDMLAAGITVAVLCTLQPVSDRNTIPGKDR